MVQIHNSFAFDVRDIRVSKFPHPASRVHLSGQCASISMLINPFFSRILRSRIFVDQREGVHLDEHDSITEGHFTSFKDTARPNYRIQFPGQTNSKYP